MPNPSQLWQIVHNFNLWAGYDNNNPKQNMNFITVEFNGE